MRGDGVDSGREPRAGRPGADPDPGTTRPFVRDDYAAADPAAGGRPQEFVRARIPSAGPGPANADSTQVFTREPGGGPERPDPDATRTMSRPGSRPSDDGTGGHDDDGGGDDDGRDHYDDDDDPPGRRGAPRRRRFKIRHAVALVVLLAVLTPFATWGWVWYTARQDERVPTDAIVVLGASQYNGRPSPIFEARLQHAAELYEAGVAPAIVTVGGNLPGDNFTEGGTGREWLIQAGVPAERVVAVEKGNDTLQSFQAMEPVFADRGWDSAVIVTDPWHALRSRVMAGDYGIEEATTSPSRSGPAVIERETQLWYITRETASLWYYWIFGDSTDLEVDATG
ncbi:uncharacterized SAM-binding protein YcdF (DUF218 family) [Murinocardiopsis flavida]|uniref:Uncharacterized SAM-binding protein YcdF (DUF218 family) n=1 Tax=Murinocardiopsis flavida TaxID=645275 RepID=A0A2P8D297_9ACTN|nr:YdcF family protein [Murinocardiopsis flavida]PSK91350.1 uncharacterized SAM-binding protein YcdF (DUF218 family) [Murinocardiopsis flavida]